jgi:hypothetical protein
VECGDEDEQATAVRVARQGRARNRILERSHASSCPSRHVSSEALAFGHTRASTYDGRSKGGGKPSMDAGRFRRSNNDAQRSPSGQPVGVWSNRSATASTPHAPSPDGSRDARVGVRPARGGGPGGGVGQVVAAPASRGAFTVAAPVAVGVCGGPREGRARGGGPGLHSADGASGAPPRRERRIGRAAVFLGDYVVRRGSDPRRHPLKAVLSASPSSSPTSRRSLRRRRSLRALRSSSTVCA